MHRSRIFMRFVVTSLMLVVSVAHADPISDADALLRKNDIAGALRVLEDATAGGNLAAKGKLAEYLRILPPPNGDVARACKLAHDAADAGDAGGAATRAECVMSGTEKSDDPFPLARQLAHQAQAGGNPSAGFVLFEAFVLDPRFNYRTDGKVDMTKYNALAATPVAQRNEQIDALNGLEASARAGLNRAASVMLGYLSETQGFNNIDRVINLYSLMQRANVPVPQPLVNSTQMALQIKQLGPTRLSVSLFKNAFTTAYAAASLQIHPVGSKDACDPKTITLTHIDAVTPIDRAVYLPLNEALDKSYLVQGSWSEQWTFSGCGATKVVTMKFAADGWGGATYSSAPFKP